MEQETDYILREVKRVTTFISNLISNISTMNSDEIGSGIKETDDFIRREWNFTFREITSLNENEFLFKVKKLPEVHIEKLAELLGELIKKNHKTDSQNKYNWKELANKGLLLINSLDKKSNVYSMRRTQIKNMLQQSL